MCFFQETLYIDIYLNLEMHQHCYNYANHNINELKKKKDLSYNKNAHIID